MAHPRPARNAPVEMRHDTGIVDQRVDLTEAIGNVVHQAAHIFFIAHVGWDAAGFTAHTDLSKRFVHPFRVGISENDLGSCFSERVRRMTPDALSPSCDDNDFTLHDCPPAVLSSS